jgi:hypothetical protein
MQRLPYVCGSFSWQIAGQICPGAQVCAQPGGRPQTGSYCMVQAVVASPTFTVVETFADCPALSVTSTVIVYVPAFAYACENPVDCLNSALAGADAAFAYVLSPQFTEYVRGPFSGSAATTVQVPVAPAASVVGPERPVMLGGRFALSKYAVQYAFSGTAQYLSVHAAMPPGVEREQELQPSYHALHCASAAGSLLDARHVPS